MILYIGLSKQLFSRLINRHLRISKIIKIIFSLFLKDRAIIEMSLLNGL